MPLNPFWIKKYAAFCLCGTLPTIIFFVLLLNSGLIQASVGFAMGVAFSAVIAAKFTGNPWQSALEGKGMLVGTLDSTGIIRTYLAQINLPFLTTKIDGKKKDTIFSRASVLFLKPPEKAVIDESEVELKFTLAKAKFNHSIFSFDGIPFLLYNKALGDFFSKEMLATTEKDTFVEHTILYLTRRIEDLSSQVRDFARYIVEQTRPKKNIWESKLMWVVLIIVAIIILALGFPFITQAIGLAGKTMGSGLPPNLVN